MFCIGLALKPLMGSSNPPLQMIFTSLHHHDNPHHGEGLDQTTCRRRCGRRTTRIRRTRQRCRCASSCRRVGSAGARTAIRCTRRRRTPCGWSTRSRATFRRGLGNSCWLVRGTSKAQCPVAKRARCEESWLASSEAASGCDVGRFILRQATYRSMADTVYEPPRLLELAVLALLGNNC